jgi:hypothetical protein
LPFGASPDLHELLMLTGALEGAGCVKGWCDGVGGQAARRWSYRRSPPRRS